MADTKRPENDAVTLRWEQSRKGGRRRDLLLVVARKQESCSSRRQKRDDGRATEEEAAEEAFKGVSFMGGLPLDLALEILRRLPLRLLVQMCILSSSFNALLRPLPKTLRLCHQPPWLVTVRVGDTGPRPELLAPRELAAYCPLSGTWFPFPPMSEGLLSAMGGSGLLQVMSFIHSVSKPCLSRLAMASAGGLMCAVVTALRPEAERLQAPPLPELCNVERYLSRHVFKCEDFYLLVFNVFTGASKRLPPPPPSTVAWPLESTPRPLEGNRVFVHMFLDASAPGAYYVVLEQNEVCLSRLDDLRIYSSRTGGWMVGHAASARPFPCTFGDIWKCDLFHFMCHTFGSALFAYSVHSDSWLSMPITPVEVRERGYWEHIFKWQGHVFLASTQKLKAGFQVSVLTAASRWSDTASWVEVARTPSGLVQRLCTAIYDNDVKFVVCGNLVCLSASYFPRRPGYHSIPLQPLVYDLAAGSWHFLPPPPRNKITGFGVGLLAFQADLQATP